MAAVPMVSAYYVRRVNRAISPALKMLLFAIFVKWGRTVLPVVCARTALGGAMAQQQALGLLVNVCPALRESMKHQVE
jgi:hypothetical protein